MKIIFNKETRTFSSDTDDKWVVVGLRNKESYQSSPMPRIKLDGTGSSGMGGRTLEDSLRDDLKDDYSKLRAFKVTDSKEIEDYKKSIK
jgi:hypothetical protein